MDTVNNTVKKMEYNNIKDFGRRYKTNDYAHIYTINIIEKSNNNNNIKNTIANNNSYSIIIMILGKNIKHDKKFIVYITDKWPTFLL